MKEIKERAKQLFNNKFPDLNFDAYYEKYKNIKPFKANENIFESGQVIDNPTHFLLRTITGLYFEEAFKAMKIDLNDPNIESDDNGNIGTPQRLSKVYCGADLDDSTELGCGRFMKPPRLATFPNTVKEDKFPITKRVDLVSNCSHHTLPFTTMFREDSYAVISYIPDEYVLGISKLQRIVDFVSRRYWLQEDLTNALFNKIKKITGSESVYVELHNIVHTCESLRGSQSKEGSFSSVKFGGLFEKEKYRRMIKM